MGIFIQTENTVIPPRGQVTVYFDGGKKVIISRVDAEQLLYLIRELSKQKVLVAIRSPEASC